MGHGRLDLIRGLREEACLGKVGPSQRTFFQVVGFDWMLAISKRDHQDQRSSMVTALSSAGSGYDLSDLDH